MSKSAIITIVVIIGVLIGGGIILMNNKDEPAPTTNTTTTQTPTTDNSSNSSTNTSKPDSGKAASLTFSDNGFSPATLTVKTGTAITITNNSSSDVQFQSDPHPAHTDDPELNVGIISAGQSKSFTVITTGTHGYHNHLDSTQTGTIVVQ